MGPDAGWSRGAQPARHRAQRVRDRFPKLTALGLHALSEVDELPRALAASTLGPRLTTWVIDGVEGRGALPEPDGIELLSTGEFVPLRSGRFSGR